jgi:hypothetical protein
MLLAGLIDREFKFPEFVITEFFPYFAVEILSNVIFFEI